jgi:hypothetical protein
LNIPEIIRLGAKLLFIAICGGCVHSPRLDSFPENASANDVRAKWGPPTQTKKKPSGERWIYSTAMEGRETWFVEFDASGKAQQPLQVLTQERVNSLKLGMGMEDVENLIGPKYYELRYPFKSDQPVHIYRYLRSPHEATCLYVHYSPQGLVIEIGYAPDALRVITLKRACQT